MAKGRRTINRIQERAPAGSDEVEDRDEAADSDEGDSEDGDEKVAKPKKVVKKKAPAVKRTRTPKVVRMRAVWLVLDNGSKPVQSFAFNQKADAEALIEDKNKEKKGGFYLQRGKEAIEEA